MRTFQDGRRHKLQRGLEASTYGTDRISPDKRSELMSKVRSKNTNPEIKVRRYLHSMGYRFRLHRRDLDGNPDVVLPKYKVVVFVDGCFWHQHPQCKKGTIPKQNRRFWVAKLMGNVRRDREISKALRLAGWHPFRLWECEIQGDTALAARKLMTFLSERKSS